MKEKLAFVVQGMKKINFSVIAFSAFAVRLLILPPDFASAAILAVFGAVYLGSRYITVKEPQKAPNRMKIEMDKLSDDIKEIKGALSKTNMAKATKSDRYF